MTDTQEGAYYTLLVVVVRRRPALPQVRHEMMMLKTETMPLTMALRMLPMPVTMAVRQLPMERRTPLTCLLLVAYFNIEHV